MQIPFNKPHLTGKELDYIKDAVSRGKISGNGYYTQKCQEFFQERYGFKKCLLTTSCTDALEMAAILCDIKPGDEVIMPSYTFVSTALAFHREGAKIVFTDSRADHPGIDEDKIEELINNKTKALVVVHYAGVACDMDKIMDIARKHNLFVVEDAAQAIDSYYTSKDGIKKPLGSIGHMAAFSFHETKNIQCGEGGMITINDERFSKRSEIIWEKGTNRAEFFRGEVNKYGWVDTGSSFLPSEVSAAFLLAQIEDLDRIQERRREIWQWYNENVDTLFKDYNFTKPYIPGYATNNSHMYYLVCKNLSERDRFIHDLKSRGIMPVFHYLSLHRSPFYYSKHDGRILGESDRYSESLVRLPMFYELDNKMLGQIISAI